MKINKVGHIGINTGDFGKTMNFYRDILGFKQHETVPIHGFEITNVEAPDGTLVELFDYGLRTDKSVGDNSVVGYRHLAFEVDNVDEWEAHLRNHDIEIRMSATVMEELGIKGILCLDPDGTEIELFEPLPA